MPHFENFTEGRAGASCISCVCCCQVWARVCGKGVDGVLSVPKRTNAQRRVRTAVSRISDSRDVAYQPLTLPHFKKFTEGRAGASCISCVCCCQVWARMCGKGVDDVPEFRLYGRGLLTMTPCHVSQFDNFTEGIAGA